MSEDLFISSEASLLDAFKQMDRTRSKLLMRGSAARFERFVSIGDLQRALLSGGAMTDSLETLPPRKDLVASPAHSLAQIKADMLAVRAAFMPVVDEAGAVRRVYTWEELFASQAIPASRQLPTTPVVIMGGGLGTRLRPLTNIIPKPLVPVGEQTMLEHIVDRFDRVGCEHYYLTINHLADVIKYYVANQTPHADRVTYVEETEPLGTAGSLHLLRDRLDRPFFVTNCDILIDQDYGEIYDYHVSRGNRMTVVTALRHHQLAYGTVESSDSGQLLYLREKPELTYAINAGMYLLEPDLLGRIPGDRPYHITELIADLVADGEQVGVFPVSEGSWVDIGNWTEYLKRKDGAL